MMLDKLKMPPKAIKEKFKSKIKVAINASNQSKRK